MNIPSTYIEWVEAINYIFSHPRNDMYIDNLNKGNLDCDNNLLQKLKFEVTDCIFNRIGKEVESFGSYLRTQIDYNSFSLKVVELKKEILYGKKLASIKIFSNEIQEEIISQIQEMADKIQNLLEEQTKMIDKTGSINSIIKNNPINKLN